eukprot:GHVU01154656.1.p1 GENE.GHVU01154656.1~~GHVU01154656.1.p1  ORF type:complete len:116 (-),score=4.55 GHVU01154656.1:584-931(-)
MTKVLDRTMKLKTPHPWQKEHHLMLLNTEYYRMLFVEMAWVLDRSKDNWLHVLNAAILKDMSKDMSEDMSEKMPITKARVLDQYISNPVLRAQFDILFINWAVLEAKDITCGIPK